MIAHLAPARGAALVLLAAFAGALGGSLSGAYRLRDQVEHINELRSFKPALWVQPLLGRGARVAVGA